MEMKSTTTTTTRVDLCKNPANLGQATSAADFAVAVAVAVADAVAVAAAQNRANCGGVC